MFFENSFTRPFAALFLLCLAVTSPGLAQSENDYSAAFWSLDTEARGQAARLWYEAEPDNARAIAAHALFVWQLDTDPNAALSLLQAAPDEARSNPRLALLEARIHLAQARPSAALEALGRATEDAGEDPDLALHEARALVALERREEARQRLDRALALAPGHLQGALLAHRLAVEDSDYAAAGEIWAMLGVVGFTRPNDATGSALLQWTALVDDQGRAAHSARADLLASWHFYAEAALEYRRAGAPANAQRMQAIADYETGITAIMDAYYLDRALGGDAVEASLWQRLEAPVSALSQAMGLPALAGADLETTVREQMAALDQQLGWLSTIGETNGRLDLHFGHIVSADPRPIDQWGQATEIDSITLFNMPSNGFSRWFWDDHAADGGWVSTGEDGRPESRRFIDVLDPKFGAALSRSAILMDGEEIMTVEAEWRQAIEEAAGGATIGYDRRVSAMIRLAALAPYRQGYDSPVDARVAAFSAIIDHFISTSTVVHEGQHILDTQHGYEGEQWLLEYRAKLTELAYGEHPLFSLAGFYAPGAIAGHGGTPHADAEVYLMRELERDFHDHVELYPSLNADLELWVQLPAISQDDLRGAARRLFASTG